MNKADESSLEGVAGMCWGENGVNVRWEIRQVLRYNEIGVGIKKWGCDEKNDKSKSK